MTPKITTLCNDCGERTEHPTRSEAFLAMDIHEWDHRAFGEVGIWQQFLAGNGAWQNYRAPVWGMRVN